MSLAKSIVVFSVPFLEERFRTKTFRDSSCRTLGACKPTSVPIEIQ